MRNILKFIGSILVGLFLIIICISCEDQRYKDYERNQKFLENNIKYNLYKIEFEGHSYLIWNKPHRGGICHDQNCECLKDSL